MNYIAPVISVLFFVLIVISFLWMVSGLTIGLVVTIVKLVKKESVSKSWYIFTFGGVAMLSIIGIIWFAFNLIMSLFYPNPQILPSSY